MKGAGPGRPRTFLIRIQRRDGGVRGQVVTVGTGATRLFDDLREAMAFIEARLAEDEEATPADPGQSV